MSGTEPTIVPSAAAPNGNGQNGTLTPNFSRGGSASGSSGAGTFGVKTGLAQMLKGGYVIFRC